MSKTTKKELKSQLDGVQNRFASLVRDLKASGYICESVYAPFAHDYQEEQSDYDALITILDSKEPQLKQLDQSVFDGLDSDYVFAAIDGSSGHAYAYEEKPYVPVGKDYWRVHVGLWQRVGYDYDTTNWQNSLSERDTAKELAEVDLNSELTGSELCKAMLARGDTRIMCKVYDIDRQHDITHVIRAYKEGKFHTKANRWTYAIPINNQGEPLTAAEAGF